MSSPQTIKQLANQLDGKLEGDSTLVISAVADLQTASDKDISFLSKKAYAPLLAETKAAAVIVGESVDVPEGMTVVRVKDPYFAYAQLSALFETRKKIADGVHPSAVVDPSAKLGEGVAIGAHCVVEANAVIGDGTELRAHVFVGQNVQIGRNAQINPHVSLYHDVVLGDEVIIHASTVIGSDGFGFAPYSGGWKKIHQLGAVHIGNRVEIGAGTAIDRGALSNTVIADGVIIDNQVHIAHNVKIGKNTAIAGCVGIAGSAEIGEGCTMGGFVAINGHIKVCDNVHLHGGTIVTKSITEPGTYASCTPMQEVRKWRKNSVRYAQLDEWVTRIKKLEQDKNT